jgi:hypothetical protein
VERSASGDEESKPMTNGQEKSDLFIVAMKLANKPWAIGRGVGGGKGRVIGVSVHLIAFQWSWAGTAM